MGWFHDTFTEAVNTPLTSHTSESGHTWVHWAGNATSPGIYPGLGGGVVGSGSTGIQVFRTSAMAADANGALRAICNYQGNFSSVGICRRLNVAGTAGYLAAYLPSTNKWYIFRIEAALATPQLAVSAATFGYAANATPDITFDVTGTGLAVTLTLTVNGTVVCSAVDESANRVTANGYDGQWFSTPTAPATGMFFGEMWGNEAVAASYAITAPQDGRVCQVAGGATGNATIAVSGTYLGAAPTQWRVVLDGTNTPIAGLDWQAFSAAPSAGAFAQTIVVPKQAGWLNVQVRDHVSGITQTSGKVGAGVLVVGDGQSWTWLLFSTTAYAGNSTLTPSSLLRITGKQPGAGNWNIPSSATMNGAIALGNALVTGLGCPVALIDGSWDASGLTVAGGAGASGSGGQWISAGAAGNAYTSSAAAITAAGGAAAATIWIQGQGDAGASVSQATYYTAFSQLTALRRASLGAGHPYVVVTHPRYLAGLSDAQVEAIRKAHIQACGDANAYRVDALDVPLHTDNVHPTADGFTTLGERVAQAVLAALGVATYYRGPRVTAATQVSATVYDLVLAHNAVGTDIAPAAGITGVRATVGGAPVTISSVVRQTASTIRVTLAATPASMPTFDVGYGAAPSVTGWVHDNSPLALPVESITGLAGTYGALAVSPGAATSAATTPAGVQAQLGNPAAATSASAASTPTGVQAQVGAVAGGTSASAGGTVAADSGSGTGAVAPASSTSAASVIAAIQAQVGAVSGAISASVASAIAAVQAQVGAVAGGVSASQGTGVAGDTGNPLGAVAPGSSTSQASTMLAVQHQVGIAAGATSSSASSSVTGTYIGPGGLVLAPGRRRIQMPDASRVRRSVWLYPTV